ncbi:EAL domain-containing protein [Stappia sp. ICDLI1TA098]
MKKNRKHEISFNSLVLGLFAIALVVTSTLLFSISYVSSLSIADREVERFARKESALVHLVFEQTLSRLDTFQRRLAGEPALRNALRARDKRAVAELLEDTTWQRMGAQFEMLIVDLPGEPGWVDASYSIFDVNAVLPAAAREAMVNSSWEFHVGRQDGETVLLAAASIPVVDNEDGQVLGHLVGAYVFNDSLPFMVDIANALDTERVTLIHRDSIIAQFGAPRGEKLPQDALSALATTDHVIENQRLYVRSSLSTAGEMDEAYIVSSRPNETLRNVQQTYREIFLPFLFYLVAASLLAAYTLHRFMSPALERLLGYAAHIRKDSRDLNYRPGRVAEFNELGKALQNVFTDLRDTNAQFRSLIDKSLHGVCIYGGERILYLNDALLEILGYDKSERQSVTDMWLTDLFPPDEQVRLLSYNQARRAGASAPSVYEARAVGKDRRIIWIEMHVRETRWNGIDAYYVTIADISERKRQEELIVRQANFDGLTGLPNRYLFRDRLVQALARAEWEKQSVALLFLDLDRFKNINDTLGHSAGDELITAAATRISAALAENDTVARLGGDEFAVILAHARDLWDIEETASRILDTLARPIVVGRGAEVFSTASIGITVFPADGRDADGLLRQADTAMYHAKADGGNAVRFFSAHMNEQAAQAMEIESALRRAIDRQELQLHYQPVIDVVAGRVAGCEALVRWTDTDKGEIPPKDFIPIAENTGLIVPLGAFVLETACRFHQACRTEGIDLPMLSVNVSPRQCRDERFLDLVRSALNTTGMPPEQLHLEITESVMFDETGSDPVQTLSALRALGVRLSLDDFGTGYSSLSNLKRFPIDTLKIDRSFVRDLESDLDAPALIEAIVALAGSLGLDVIAEGAETEGQCEALTALGCRLIQGFHLGRPMPGDAFRAFVRAHDTLSAPRSAIPL